MSARGLLLDVGVVFFKSAWEIADDYELMRGLPPGTVIGRGPLDPHGDELWQEYLAGRATERDYWLSFANRAVANGAPLDGHPTLMRAIFQTPGVDVVRPQAQALVDIAEQHGIALGILTNELMDFQGRTWVEAQPWFRQFSVLIDSSELGMRKPSPEPYEIAIAAMGIPAAEIVFIDDNPTYVEGGTASGMQSLLLDVLDPSAVFRDAASRLGLRVEFEEFFDRFAVGQ